MNTQKSRLIVAAAVVIGVAIGLLIPIMTRNAKKQNAPPEQDSVVSDTSAALSGTARQEPVDADIDSLSPQAKPPVLKIYGKENPGVYLQTLDIQVEVAGNIASTRYTMIFKNKTDRVLEGELTFPLPEGRAVTYYALDINGKMREAVPVEKAKGTDVFEDIVRRQVDPGLLERVEGDNFRARVYPIPAYGTRAIAIGYEEELALEKDSLRYRLQMAYPAPLEKFAVKATVWKSGLKPLVPESADELSFDKAGENYVASFARDNYRPARALSFALPAPADIPRVMMQPAQGSHYFLASVAPKLETRKKQWGDELAIIWDVSLSGSQRDLKREMEILNIIFAEKKNAGVHLYFLNNKFKKAADNGTNNGEYKVNNGNWAELKKTLETAVFDGGTDFSQINLNDVAGNEILFFSDGISTLGDADFIKNTTVKRPIHCVVSSAKADYSAMKLLAGKSKGKFINTNALSTEKLKDDLLNETPLFLGTEHGKSVREVYPGIATPVRGDFSAAGISDINNAELTLLFGFGDKVEKRLTVKLDAKSAGGEVNAYKIWAQKKIAELDLNYEKNRAELTELGRQFGIATRNTSLIVLESVNDYVRYNITPPATEDAEPPAEYRQEAETRRGWVQRPQKGKTVASANFFGKGGLSADIDAVLSGAGGNGGIGRKGAAGIGYFSNDRAPSSKSTRISFARTRESFEQTMNRIDKWAEREAMAREGAEQETSWERAERQAAERGITWNHDTLNGAVLAAEYIKHWRNTDFTPPYSKYPTPDEAGGSLSAAGSARGRAVKTADYLKEMTGKTADDYQTYLNLREGYANSPAFYFDMASWFHACGDKETALRALTCIADLDLENAALYRLLGYRLKEFGEYALEKFVCQKVLQWRPTEAQSYRDYALALADNGEAQAALDSLYGLLTKNYSENIAYRYHRSIGEVTVTEINRLLAKNPNLNKSKIYKRLLADISVDVRVVINWNLNNTDIDLRVVDPTGEECYHRRRETKSGGRISADVVNGYGPEQFLLKKAVKGKYKVYVNNYGDRQVTDAGPLTVMAEIYTKYADKAENRKVVCLQLSNARQRANRNVLVAEFEF